MISLQEMYSLVLISLESIIFEKVYDELKMSKRTIFSRRSFIPILGSSFLLPFLVSAKETKLDEFQEEEYKTLLKPDGTVVKVKLSALKNAKVVRKKISNKSFLEWIGKKF